MVSDPIILFDGVCNLCNKAVDFVIQRDPGKQIKFASLQSKVAGNLLSHSSLDAKDLSSFVFIENGILYTQSTAALKLCRYLNGLWPLCYGLIIIPPFFRNWIYSMVSRNRYRWFGKKESCRMPEPEIIERFLKDDI